jgi:hypothetical protein
VSPSGSRALYTVLTIVMNILIACAVVVTLRLLVEFFGQLAHADWGKAVVAYTSVLVIPVGFHAVKTPYGGVFDITAALWICLFLVLEWVVSSVRSRV